MKTKAFLFATAVALVSAVTAAAQDNGLKLHFDFNTATENTVTDVAGGIQAKLMNQAKVTKMGQYGVLDLGNGTGYLDMTASAGQIVRQLENFTVSAYYRIDETASLSGAGHFLWSFSQSEANTQYASPYMAYRLNAQRMAISTGGWSGETAVSIGSESQKGSWIHVLYRQTGQTGELFLNGVRKLQSNTMPVLKNAFTASPAYNWIGRAPFSGDSYLKQTLVADFRLYDHAVSDDEVAQLSSVTTSLDDAYENGGGGDNTALLAAISEAETIMASSNDYPEAAVITLSDVVTVAKNVSKKDCNQMTYDQQTDGLKTAINVFKQAKGYVFDVSGITDVYDTNRGFRHPGGLHTEADFERIRQQLADGNARVTEAYNKLKAAEYSQSGVNTYPVETIVRGGGSGENYINAARGATMAYQNALRWKIEGTKANATAAVRILMAWAKTCKAVSGDSNWALAAGLYGYEFAQAAELMRDYEGWTTEDFEEFKQWMLTVWYPGNINFLRGRNGTWENWVGNQGGIRPGHYWSNWPLCNALAVISIGILCDDVFIYNQGMSFMKYDQVGTFQDPRTANPILNDGCTEFIGNLVVTTHESPLETGAYGKLGQMQESGRDGGHAAMALGLAVDICQVAWNQGDDLYSYMDNRMAAGIEFVAACTQNVQGLPWTNYKYVDCRTAWHNGWLMSGPAEPAEVRNYWGRVIGHYEGVKGVKMPFAEQAFYQMGIDVGGTGGSSGAYDHLGYTVLTNTYNDQFCPESQRPTLLTPRMEYEGQVINHNELGGLRNTYINQSTQCLPTGKSIKLMPQLPEGTEDSGLWQWNTGQTTKDISVTTDRSAVYRVTYTNQKGVKSEQVFTVAVEGDCMPSRTKQSIHANGEQIGDTTATVFYGDKLTLSASDVAGWWTEVCWDNGQKGNELTLQAVTTERTVRGYIVNQGGRKEMVSYRLKVKYIQPDMEVNGTKMKNTSKLMATAGDVVILQPYVPTALGAVSYEWSNGSKEPILNLGAVENSGIYTVTISNGEGNSETISYEIFVKGTDTSRIVPTGNYMMRHVATDTYLTCNALQEFVTFTPGSKDAPTANQTWNISANGKRHMLTSLKDNLYLGTTGRAVSTALAMFYFEGPEGLDRYALHSGIGTSAHYWTVSDEGEINFNSSSKLDDFPYELIPVGMPEGIQDLHTTGDCKWTYDLQGRRVEKTAKKGIYIERTSNNRLQDKRRKVIIK